MTKHTMQEWADFTGCYVAKSRSQSGVCLYGEKPQLERWFSIKLWAGEFCAVIKGDLVADFATHDYRVLVEPHTEASHE